MVTPVILATQRQRSGGWRLKASPGTLSRKTTSQKRADGVAQDEGQVQAPVPPKKKNLLFSLLKQKLINLIF
jgi:hypothetical protein